MEKNKDIEDIKVIVDIPNGVTGLVNRVNLDKNICTNFRALDGLGQPYELFGKYETEDIREYILNQYNELYPNLTEEEKEIIKKRIIENIDVSIYDVLNEYDNKEENSSEKTGRSKSALYIDAMLKEIPKKEGETETQFKKREIATRKEELEKSGISLMYDFGKIFSKNTNVIDTFKIMRNAIKNKDYAEFKFFGKKLKNNNSKIKIRDNITKIKEETSEKAKKSIENLKEKVKKHFTSKQNTLNQLRKMAKDKEIKKKAKASIASLLVAGGIVFGGIAIKNSSNSNENNIKEEKNSTTFSQNLEKNNTTYQAETTKSFIETQVETAITSMQKDEETDSTTIKESIIEDTQTQTEVITSMETENIQNFNTEDSYNESDKEEIDYISEENEKDIDENEISIENSNTNVEMKELLMATLDIGFDTEFRMESGKFYEAPDGSGRFGRYENVDKNVKINKVDAIKDGKFVQYKIDSGKTFAEIFSETDEIISFHTIKSDGQILGWNVNIDEIEDALIESEMSRIYDYMSEEEKQYFEEIDLNKEVNAKDKEILNHLTGVKQAKEILNHLISEIQAQNTAINKELEEYFER